MNGMSRAEHLAFCKQRALEYVDAGKLDLALASMGSDLAKHPDTRELAGDPLMLVGMHAAVSNDAIAMRQWVESFN